MANGVKVKHLTDRHFEIAVVGSDGLDHNIADVGFGCSQVLPVLVSGLKSMIRQKLPSGRVSFGHSTLVVQEPEIHLHPNAQAELGSFFVGVANKGPQVFLETHSDNMVLRVARHIAAGDIDADAVRIFYIRDDNGTKSVSRIEFDESGRFKPEWPGGFFPQRQSESFELAKASVARVKKIDATNRN
ncbi:DUF3696 domain-containing protein [Rhodobacter sp. 24-YEA-8]|uniref:AAA family ATPase n=1 Tax=Rhodobacter sp. 24-YEA-8 TaxID=1884310 RepID=UPI0025B7A0CB|nr:DUF3696 domain-containing protein [Rhodobacter sp. 24-YEA-8]